jgi:glyoxylase-like metal-dependent hydrolase (beta-lactamase superfamily II)
MDFMNTHFSRWTTLLLALAFAVFLAPQANAAEPVASATPAYYKITLGKFTIIALNDGLFQLATDQLLVDKKPGEVSAVLAANHQPALQSTSVNAYLIDTGTKRILVDSGSGSYFGPSLGFVLKGLAAAGYRPEDIDEVLITHLHPDHVGGLSADGKMLFPHATVRLAEAERTFWLDSTNTAKVDASVKASFAAASASLAPYLAAGRVKGFKPGAVLEPGITSVSLPGHTIGHAGYRIRSAGKTLLIWGDILHVALVQLKDPAITIKFDSVPSQAFQTRTRIMADAAKHKYLIAAAHLAFPGIGTIAREASHWQWVPVVISSKDQ